MSFFLREAVTNRLFSLDGVEYHLQEKSTYSFFCETCQNELENLVPEGVRVKFKRWKQIPMRDDLHDRFVLTDKWGVGFSVGLDEGNTGEYTKVRLLSEDVFQEERDKFLSSEPEYELVDEYSIVGKMVV